MAQIRAQNVIKTHVFKKGCACVTSFFGSNFSNEQRGLFVLVATFFRPTIFNFFFMFIDWKWVYLWNIVRFSLFFNTRSKRRHAQNIVPCSNYNTNTITYVYCGPPWNQLKLHDPVCNIRVQTLRACTVSATLQYYYFVHRSPRRDYSFIFDRLKLPSWGATVTAARECIVHSCCGSRHNFGGTEANMRSVSSKWCLFHPRSATPLVARIYAFPGDSTMIYASLHNRKGLRIYTYILYLYIHAYAKRTNGSSRGPVPTRTAEKMTWDGACVPCIMHMILYSSYR